MDLKATLNLPDPNATIPMKADLATREPAMQAHWEEICLYHLIQTARSGQPTFVLHDGPPYTNSPIHIGTAMNKMLKDFVLKSRTMMGFQCPYVPGFDNHGLPIEQAVLKAWSEEVAKDEAKLRSLGFDSKPSETALTNRLKDEVKEFRTRCRAHAQKYIALQTEQFKRLGIPGLWENPYMTMGYRYEAGLIRVFARLVKNEQVYKGLRPVMWSPSIRTALADTEIIYLEHTSKAIYVKFKLKTDPNHLFKDFTNLSTVIWTTTPWTIPANLACAFHPGMLYSVVAVGDEHWLLLEDLVDATMQKLGLAEYKVAGTILGENLEGVIFTHPVFGRDSIAVMADYVTTEDGTGVVHTAPGHGRDDFMTGLKYNLPILCPVDEGGVLTSEAGEFAGVFYKKCDEVVVDRLRELGALLHAEDFVHQYPHGERDEKPIIFRATEQWFISVDGNDLRQNMKEQIDRVQWFPETAKNRIQGMVNGRPDWCVSRQRPWGVGIPVFYGKDSRKPILDPEVMEHVAKIVEQEGSDAWFLRDAASLLPEGFTHPETGETEFVKETDVFDVWFDSGCTNLLVLEGDVEPEWKAPWPADLYLEGSDQHRGWFNTSLIIGTATRGEAPYKAVVTHGFVLDEKLQKMAKRAGNVVDPVTVCNQHGADILRYWLASVDYTSDVPCGESLFKQAGEQYRTIRNTLRFLLGNLSDYEDGFEGELLDPDRWIMEQTELLIADCHDAYLAYDFGKVITGIHNFCANEISRTYADAIKDRMYCDLPQWPTRKSAQVACHFVLTALTKLVAPILCHTAEEVYSMTPGIERLASVHLESWTRPTEQRLDEEIAGNDLQTRFATLLDVRAEVFTRFEAYKGTDGIKNSQDAICSLTTSVEIGAVLDSFGDDLANLFKMSAVEITVGEPEISFRASEYLDCARCRLRRPDVKPVNGVNLSARDRRALEELGMLETA